MSDKSYKTLDDANHKSYKTWDDAIINSDQLLSFNNDEVDRKLLLTF